MAVGAAGGVRVHSSGWCELRDTDQHLTPAPRARPAKKRALGKEKDIDPFCGSKSQNWSDSAWQSGSPCTSTEPDKQNTSPQLCSSSAASKDRFPI